MRQLLQRAWPLGLGQQSTQQLPIRTRIWPAAASHPQLSDVVGASAGLPPRHAYVHIPFCKRKCFYCDFPVEALGRSLGSECEQSHTLPHPHPT